MVHFSTIFDSYLTKEEQVYANKAEQELINEINKFSSSTQASKTAAMIGAYDTLTGKIAVGSSSTKISAEVLDPKTVGYVEKQLGVKIGEFTNLCSNMAGACAEVSAADKLIRQGVDPSRIKFTQAVRPRFVYKNGGGTNSSVVETCPNCAVTFPKGVKND